jgi:uncharacterized membrane protein YebE (DUF533 family)
LCAYFYTSIVNHHSNLASETRMSERAPQIPLEEGVVSSAARQVFLRSKTSLGAMTRGFKPGMTAAMIVEEGAFYAEQKYQRPGLAAAGALLGEGLWFYQVQKDRQARESGRQV